jgi:hypothetical protein
MSPVGRYVSNGQTVTWTQPPESEGPITSVPYTPTPAPSSSCVTYASQDLYSQLNNVIAPAASTTLSGSGSQPTSSRRPGASGTSGANGPTASGTNGASTMGISLVACLSGVFFSAFFFA